MKAFKELHIVINILHATIILTNDPTNDPTIDKLFS